MTESSPDVVKYIEYLEGRGVPKLQLALAHVCDILADDIELAITGSKELLLLSSDDKTFQNFLSVVSDDAEETQAVAYKSSNDNPFEAASKRVKAKINGGTG